MTRQQTMIPIDIHTEQACIRLSARFAALVDLHLYDQVAELFTDDAVFSRGGEIYEGLNSIMGLLNARPSTLKTLHLCGLPVIRSLGPTAAEGLIPFVFISSLTQQKKKGKANASSPLLTAAGYYVDVYRNTDAGWKIARRTVEPFFPVPA